MITLLPEIADIPFEPQTPVNLIRKESALAQKAMCAAIMRGAGGPEIHRLTAISQQWGRLFNRLALAQKRYHADHR